MAFRKRGKEEETGEEEPQKRSMLQRAVEKGKAKVFEEAEEGVKAEAKEALKEALKEERKKWGI